MANGHNSIKRIVHRSCEEIGATFRIARATSWSEAINTFRAKLDIQVMSRNGYKEPPAVKERLLRKHETVLKYLENRFGDFFESYDYDAPLPPSDPTLEGKIWMCWWQGEENAPEIVRACIDSVRRNAGGHEVIVITDENLSDYAHIPDWVLEKVRAGVLKYLENRFGDFFESYDYDAPLPPSDPTLEGKIWMCWWQGEENAPEIVRACIDSVRRNAGGHEVIVITDENLSDYAHIPDWVLEKVRAGIMSRTNLSDLLRLSLLAEHGGMWLDATFFCAGSLGEYMDLPIWSIKRPDYLHASVACGMFAGYSLACKEVQRHPFVVARDFFLEYWRNSDRLIDYLLVDYLIVLAQRHDPSVAAAFASIEPNNPRCDDLISILDRPFDQSAWSELLLDTSLFKLTWKQEFPKQTDGRQTYYGRLLEGGLS